MDEEPEMSKTIQAFNQELEQARAARDQFSEAVGQYADHLGKMDEQLEEMHKDQDKRREEIRKLSETRTERK